MNLSESEREDAFPVHIDLGRKLESGPMAAAAETSEKKGKDRVVYPTFYIDAVEGLENLPREGCILIKFRRKRLSVEDRDGKMTAGAELEIRALCLPESMESDGEYDMEAAMKRFADGKSDEDEDEEESEDEKEE